MPKLIDPAQDCERPVQESTDANSVTHPAWCSDRWCWAYPASHDNPEPGEQPRPGGYHQSDTLAIDTLNHSPITLELTLDHGKADALPELQLTLGASDDCTTRHLSLDQAADLYQALALLVPGLVNVDAGKRLFELGVRHGNRQAAVDTAEAFRVGDTIGRERVSRETREALARIQKRFDDAEKHVNRAYKQGYANGYVDHMDGVEPEFEVQR